jgi:glutamate-1-semialdehyde 2,1-aminomutase
MTTEQEESCMVDYVSKTPKSKALYEGARRTLPGGVTYGIRYFEPYPFYAARAKGSKLWDIDGNEYVDYWLGHTALILGHSPKEVVREVKEQVENGTHYGVSNELEVALAEQAVKMVPCAEMIRFTNSGTEANMYAIRLARAFTGRNKIAKFEGGWHGGYDALHVGVKQPFDLPESAGLTPGAVQDTLLLPYNDLEGVEKRLRHEHPACIIVEPMLGSGGGIPADKEFLKGLREFCNKSDILLIFDEVITGFRLAPGGGQEYYGVTPDITVLGKVLGGGFPVGAFCGPRRIMKRLDTTMYKRPQYSFHGGTFVGNPITMIAGLTTLKMLEDGKVTTRLNRLGDKIRMTIRQIFGKNGVDVQTLGAGSIFNTLFTDRQVFDACSAFRADKKKLFDYNIALITKGIFFLPTHSQALSTAHSKADIEKLFTETEEYAKHRMRTSN